MAKHNGSKRGLALECSPGEAYDEKAFRYFLDIERARAGRSKNPLRLLIATLEPVPGSRVQIPAASAVKLFEGLRQSLRETDVTGWYEQGHVAGAVLAARPGPPEPAFVTDQIEQRVGDGLRHRLPSRIARSLRVQVIQIDA